MNIPRGRLAFVVGLCLIVALWGAASSPAGPVDADGEPLHLSRPGPGIVTVAPDSATAGQTTVIRAPHAVPSSTPSLPLPREPTASDEPWLAPPALAGALVAVLTLIALTFVVGRARPERSKP